MICYCPQTLQTMKTNSSPQRLQTLTLFFSLNFSYYDVNAPIDINLLDKEGKIIEKETLSKGEQQLYATALLKSLVDESGIQFPIFIDSPLQKFDKRHSKNIITEFYPSISKQVVLFPLLEKELTEDEYSMLLPFVSQTFIIKNSDGKSIIRECNSSKLFNEITKNNNVHTH